MLAERGVVQCQDLEDPAAEAADPAVGRAEAAPVDSAVWAAVWAAARWLPLLPPAEAGADGADIGAAAAAAWAAPFP